MTIHRRTKLIKEGNLLAEIEVELIEDSSGWCPYLSIEDAAKPHQVRAALRSSDVSAAKTLAKVYQSYSRDSRLIRS